MVYHIKGLKWGEYNAVEGLATNKAGEKKKSNFSHVNANDMLDANQYGFRAGRSAEDQLLLTYPLELRVRYITVSRAKLQVQ